MAKEVGAWPGAVEAWSRLWGRCNGPWRCDQDRGGVARGHWIAANAVGVQTVAVGARQRP